MEFVPHRRRARVARRAGSHCAARRGASSYIRMNEGESTRNATTPADDGDTAATLLAVARPLFAQLGYDAASVRAITAAAGANLGAITYHFGSKRALYDRVVAGVVGGLAERIRAASSGDAPVLERICVVVRTYFAYLLENPDMPRLLMQELVLGGAPPAALTEPMSSVHGMLAGLVREGQQRGEVRSGEAALLALFIMSVPVHLAVVHVPLRSAIGMDLFGDAVRGVVVEHATKFVLAGLAAEATT
jgi:AcrR family transcriptional regulator